MNERFEGTRERLAGTMKNMLRMASRGTGVGWRTWLLFIAAVVFVFWWVWI
jgi:blocked-early-in-transport protein 1